MRVHHGTDKGNATGNRLFVLFLRVKCEPELKEEIFANDFNISK